MKEVLSFIQSLLPFGRNFILEPDILFRACKFSKGTSTNEIKDGLLPSLLEGNIYASSESLPCSTGRLLPQFDSQRTVTAVDKHLIFLHLSYDVCLGVLIFYLITMLSQYFCVY